MAYFKAKKSIPTLQYKKLAVLLSAVFASMSANANPDGGVVTSGNATISQSATHTEITQTSDKAIINWNSFNIQAGESTHFQQPSSSSIVLNRINPDSGASSIFGQLTATGRVILVNQSGIFFGSGASVNVGSLIASTRDITDQNFLAGKLIFDQKLPQYNGSVINKGTITVANNGLAALIGSNVSNEGYIYANSGSVVLASGNKFTLDLAGDGLINFVVDEAATTAGVDEQGNSMHDGVKNSGTIIADGGKVILTAKAASGVVDNVINMSGVVQARSVSTQNGEVIFSAEGPGVVRVTGNIDVASSSGAPHGIIKISGDQVTLDAYSQTTFSHLFTDTTIQVSTNLTINVPNLFDYAQFSGLIYGSGSLTKVGGGILALQATNTYLGNTYITSGVIQVATNGALSTGLVNIGNGTLLLDNNVSLANDVEISSNNDQSAHIMNLGVSILSGNITIDDNVSGIIDALIFSQLNLTGSTISLGNNASLSLVTDDSTSSIAVLNAIMSNYAANNINIVGAGRVALNSSLSNYGGSTTVSGGELVLGASSIGQPGNIISGPIGRSNLSINWANLSSSQDVTIGNDINSNINVNGLNIVGSHNLTLTGSLDINGLVNKNTAVTTLSGMIASNNWNAFSQESSGRLVLEGVSQVYGSINAMAGTVELKVDQPSANLFVNQNATLNISYSDGYLSSQLISLNGYGVDGRGAMVISGNNLDIFSFISLDSDTSINTQGSASMYSGIFGNGAAFTKLGGGALTLNYDYGSPVNTGSTYVNEGTLNVVSSNVLSESGDVGVMQNAALNVSGNNSAAGLYGDGNLNINSGMLTVGNYSSSGAFNGVISGAGQLVKTGYGDLALSGANSLSGGIVINQGRVIVNNPLALGSMFNEVTLAGPESYLVINNTHATTGSIVSNGGAISGVGQAAMDGDITLGGVGVVLIADNASDELTLNGATQGYSTLVTSGLGRIIIAGEVGKNAPILYLNSFVNELVLKNNIHTDYDQQYFNKVTLGSDVMLSLASTGSIAFKNGIDGGKNLVLKGGNQVGTSFEFTGDMKINNLNIMGELGVNNALSVNTNNAKQRWSINASNTGGLSGIAEMTGIFQFSNIQNLIDHNTNSIVVNGPVLGLTSQAQTVHITTAQTGDVDTIFNFTGMNVFNASNNTAVNFIVSAQLDKTTGVATVGTTSLQFNNMLAENYSGNIATPIVKKDHDSGKGKKDNDKGKKDNDSGKKDNDSGKKDNDSGKKDNDSGKSGDDKGKSKSGGSNDSKPPLPVKITAKIGKLS